MLVVHLKGNVSKDMLDEVLRLQELADDLIYINYKVYYHTLCLCDDSYCITTYDNQLRLYCEDTYFDKLETIADCLNEF